MTPANNLPTRDDIVGSYFCSDSAASGLRLTLQADGKVQLEKWLDLGGEWMMVRKGSFIVAGPVVVTSLRDFDWCFSSFARDGELHARRLLLMSDDDNPTLELCTVLSPSDSIEMLDKAIQEEDPHLAELSGSLSILKLRLFFRQ